MLIYNDHKYTHDPYTPSTPLSTPQRCADGPPDRARLRSERGHKQASTRETPLLFGGKVGLLDATMCVRVARFESSVPLSYLALCILVLALYLFFFSRNHHASFRLMHFELFWSSRSMPMFLFPSSLGTQHISHIPLIFNNFFFRACVAFLFLKSLASFFPPFLKSKKRFYRQLFSLFLSPSCSILWFLSTCTCRF